MQKDIKGILISIVTTGVLSVVLTMFIGGFIEGILFSPTQQGEMFHQTIEAANEESHDEGSITMNDSLDDVRFLISTVKRNLK